MWLSWSLYFTVSDNPGVISFSSTPLTRKVTFDNKYLKYSPASCLQCFQNSDIKRHKEYLLLIYLYIIEDFSKALFDRSVGFRIHAYSID